MSLRLITQIAGIAGSIASVVGVSTSNYRSKKPANTDPTHKWKIETDRPKLEISCKGTSTGFGISQRPIDATLRLSLPLKEVDSSPLVNGKILTTQANVELIEKDGRRKLWPVVGKSTGDEVITISGNDNGKDLKIKLTGSEPTIFWLGGHSVRTTALSADLTCHDDGLFNIREKSAMLYQGLMKRVGVGRWTSIDSKPWRVQVGLSTCVVSPDKKTAECDLKLTTGSDLDWSTKVSAKAKFTISQ